MADLSIIIVNYNMKGLLKQCLKGIDRFSAHGIQTEVIVVDNASMDGSGPLLHQYAVEQPFGSFEFRCLLKETNDGYGVANNEGMRASRGQWVLILNPDIAVMANSIERLLEYARMNPRAAVVGPRLLNPDKSLQYSCYSFPTLMTPLYRRTPLGATPQGQAHIERYMMTDWGHDHCCTVDWVMGSAMMVRRSAIGKIGGFDERFFMYFEDIDWCRRFWNAGYEVHYLPQAIMAHYHQRLSAELGWRGITTWATRTHIQSALRYFAKYRGSPNPRSRRPLERVGDFSSSDESELTGSADLAPMEQVSWGAQRPSSVARPFHL